MNRVMKKFVFVIIAMLISIAFYFGLSLVEKNQSALLDDTIEKYNNGLAVNLDSHIKKETLIQILLTNGYVDSDKIDACLIADSIISKIGQTEIKGGKLKNLGELNTDTFKIPGLVIEKYGGEYLHKQLNSSYSRLGYDSVVIENYYSRKIEKDTVAGDFTIRATVLDKNKNLLSGVLVRLMKHDTDTTDNKLCSNDKPIAYKFTDKEGQVCFKVDREGHYSVLPIKHGYEYGSPKGTTHGGTICDEKKLLDDPLFSKNEIRYEFTQLKHKVKMFNGSTYANIKRDGAFTVRTPQEYKDILRRTKILFLCAWWGLLLFLHFRDKLLINKDPQHFVPSDKWIVPFLMCLNAICLISMYSIPHPLTDKLIGWEMAGLGTVGGVIILAFFSWWNYVDIYAMTRPIWLNKLCQTYPRFNRFTLFLSKFWGLGYGYLCIALMFVLLLSFFGTAPEGSSAKVNLNFGITFQPSEISKFLFLVFISLFLTANAWRISEFAKGGHLPEQLKVVGWFFVSVVVLLFLYVAVLSDMGPALVLVVTFILLYSLARKDFLQMGLGTLLYLFMFFVCSLWIHNWSVAIIAFLIWLTLWLYIYKWKGQLYESAIFMNLLILLFSVGGHLIKPILSNQGQRLLDRSSMMGDGMWNNVVRGGDQIANGIWALASGGADGQGLGYGNANLIPAFHTDMVFQSIGEVMGFWILMIILFAFVLFTIRCLVRALDTRHTFLFFMVSGLAIVTCVQFFVIVMGSLGLIPLTGISVPFLSFGKTGLIINLAAFGMLLAMTRQRSNSTEFLSKPDMYKWFAIIIILPVCCIVAKLSEYQLFARDTYLVKPAFIIASSGDRIAEQNPRIDLLLKKLHSGNIYDRNGLLLATSDRDTLSSKPIIDQLTKSGLSEKELLAESHKHRWRYYPYGNHLFFMLGDINTGNLLKSIYAREENGKTVLDPYGYFAEERHLDYLKGMAFKVDTIKDLISYNRISPFLPEEEVHIDNLHYRDYSQNGTIIAMLKQGIEGDLVEKWNENEKRKRERDLYMTIDASLQMELQNELEKGLPGISKHRASVVIINATNGDLLCSANYPLPYQDTITQRLNDKIWFYKHKEGFLPVTDRDLGMTFQTPPGSTAKIISSMAGFMKLGMAAKDKEYYIHDEEVIDRNKNGAPAEPTSSVTMKEAIRMSSNCYFINSVHDQQLYSQLKTIYSEVGNRVDNREYKSTPYFLYKEEFDLSSNERFSGIMNTLAEEGYHKYNQYKQSKEIKKMNMKEWRIAWGQDPLRATPLNMARVISVIANKGKFVPTRYVIMFGNKEVLPFHSVELLNEKCAEALKEMMQFESDKHRGKDYGKNLPLNKKELRIGGKTGTAERGDKKPYHNDCWYICFIQSEQLKSPLAIATRIEDMPPGQMSPNAVELVANTIIPTLNKKGYKVK